MTVSSYELIQLMKDCSTALQIPVLIFDSQYKLIHKFPESFEKPPVELSRIILPFLKQSEMIPYSLQIYADDYDQNIFIYATHTSKDGTIFLAFGPFLQYEYGRKQIHKLMHSNKHSLDENTMLAYFQQLPVFKSSQISSLERILWHLLPSNEENGKEDIVKKSSQNYSKKITSPLLSEQLKDHFLDAFKKNSPEMLIIYEKYKVQDSQNLANGDKVRSAKNKMIRLITELVHICLEAGSGSSRDDILLLSEFYTNHLEMQTELEALEALEKTIIQSFRERLHPEREESEYSPLVERSQRYIFQNLSEEISLKDIAHELNIHPGYLSSMFKKEVGVSVSHFINAQRIQEAKELLSITDYSLMEISTILGYNSQSYFTRVFKQFEGMGPKEFRNKFQTS
ncbi:helix-turn-helix domain-containing protein [Halobacillus fulvus]|nr:helix-turn-helix domain-containing protein [Halobacillus fulvus]